MPNLWEDQKLSLRTKLNIKANELATFSLKNLYLKPRVPLDQITGVLFHYRDHTITRDFKETIHSWYNSPSLRDSTGNKLEG